jgi:hypothetical protein
MALPAYSLDCFSINSGVLCWVDEPTHAELVKTWKGINKLVASRLSRKHLPWGEAAGWRDVHGRGRIVNLSNHKFLSCDMLAALRDGGRFPWDGGTFPQGTPTKADDGALKMIYDTWTIEGKALVWKINVHANTQTGSVAKGLALYGRDDTAISRHGVAYLSSDIRHVLEQGSFPWQW